MYKWIEAWLTDRKQRVKIDNFFSEPVIVTSGVPQGTVLGPILFNLFINDLNQNNSSEMKLYADDCLLYRIVNDKNDTITLQNDLILLENWSTKWQMKFNPEKCQVITFNKRLNEENTDYYICNEKLEQTETFKYLGVHLQSNLKWDQQVDNALQKGNRSLGFLRRHYTSVPKNIKEHLVKATVFPHIQYAATCWDPHQQHLISRIEIFQRKCARFIIGNFKKTPGSATSCMRTLGWAQAKTQRKLQRLLFLFKCKNNLCAVKIPDYFLPKNCMTRSYHSDKFIQPFVEDDTYKHSFFPQTINEWNELPNHIIECNNLKEFRTDLKLLLES